MPSIDIADVSLSLLLGQLVRRCSLRPSGPLAAISEEDLATFSSEEIAVEIARRTQAMGGPAQRLSRPPGVEGQLWVSKFAVAHLCDRLRRIDDTATDGESVSSVERANEYLRLVHKQLRELITEIEGSS